MVTPYPLPFLESLSNVGIACMPVAAFITYQAAEAAGYQSPSLVAFAALLVTGLLAPSIKWLMRRSDRILDNTTKREERRERREDIVQDALLAQLTAQVVALGSIAKSLERMVSMIMLPNSHQPKDQP
jgi:hypothetical protein